MKCVDLVKNKLREIEIESTEELDPEYRQNMEYLEIHLTRIFEESDEMKEKVKKNTISALNPRYLNPNVSPKQYQKSENIYRSKFGYRLGYRIQERCELCPNENCPHPNPNWNGLCDKYEGVRY